MNKHFSLTAYGAHWAGCNRLMAILAASVTLFAASAWADDSVPPSAPLIVAFGDSLTAGYGLGPGEAFPNQLEDILRENGYSGAVVKHAGVSGDTSAGGRSRLTWNLSALPRKPDLLILELGANDALRGILPERTRANIDAMLNTLAQKGIPVLLAGMLAPPNLGDEYGAEFNSLYPDLAQAYDVPLYPFFLEGVAADASVNQADGIHPTKEGIAIIARNILPHVVAALNGVPLAQAAAPHLQSGTP
ncbi:MAG: arylesterase [Pseudomonadota bacterium]